ncbi:single-stranded DNA-binding protein [Lipingzhangella halophila]|uniref:Single-stranded DNA-binding protein n=1 Tax=Lipingzhangella halophila TaxID=1783352 RepID=A0A7W7RIE2_9ACTN|nr:single-stranded DNA-binding protein [Lipingzhangella halophila]MBB4932467.1 single-stranded DNA-binding protein [Lipingzhangella halophila]
MPKLSSTSAPATPVPAQEPLPDVGGDSQRSEPRSGWRPHDDAGHRNEVVLAGRVTAEPAVRELPSGTHLVTWRISVIRPAADQRPNQPADPITCVSFHPSIEDATRGWRIGDLVQVSGALRRRFWRSPNGSSSVIEVEARNAQRVTAAGSGHTAREPDHQPK